ncbi:hypothetical protein H7F50_09245 [Novosphingobium flavum]|uniref:CC_3452 family protein n=1 Tax=Novosphingobium aerophilum TaxID=2839843 RepID=UPI00163A8485|nr:hypothetical protein [Novosphingobium aerophilum]MBC2661945.1 hypothetical protein [Novosphingobium aerophilum]
MARTLSATLLATLATLALPAALAPAQAAPAGWTATLREPLAQPRHDIVNSVVWTCIGTQCTAPAQDSRPAIVCRKVVQKFGPLTRFTSPAGELEAEALAKCNG